MTRSQKLRPNLAVSVSCVIDVKLATQICAPKRRQAISETKGCCGDEANLTVIDTARQQRSCVRACGDAGVSIRIREGEVASQHKPAMVLVKSEKSQNLTGMGRWSSLASASPNSDSLYFR